MLPLTPIIGSAVISGATQYAIQEHSKDVINYSKDVIDTFKSDYSYEEYEVGYSVTRDKILDINSYNNEKEEIKEKIKEIEEEPKIQNPNTQITDIINMENMAILAAYTFFIYGTYKIIVTIDKYID